MNKTNEYRKLNDKQFGEEIQKLEIELVKSYGMMGMAKVKSKKDGTTTGGSNLSKRIKKEIARVLTIQREIK